QVVGFRRAAGEDDLLGRRVDQGSNLLPGGLHRFFASPAERVVAARGVPELLREIGQHRLQHARIHWCGGVIVHVNRQLDGHFPVLLSRWEASAQPVTDRRSIPFNSTSAAGSCVSSLNCAMVTVLNTPKMLSFTRRNGSLMEQRSVASQFPCVVTQEMISTGPSIAVMTSRAETLSGA